MSCSSVEKLIDLALDLLNMPEPMNSTIRTTATTAMAQRQTWSEPEGGVPGVLPGPLPGRVS